MAGELWYPGAGKRPGNAAGYTIGRTSMTAVKLHFTDGYDSTSIGMRGYFQWLVRRDGEIVQFAEADAQCWDSGDGNPYGPGIEFEYRVEREGEPNSGGPIVTPQAAAAAAGLIRWLHDEWNIPLVFFDQPKAASFPLVGFVTHRSLPAPNDHVDYIAQTDWDAMVGGSFISSGPQPEDDDMKLVAVHCPELTGDAVYASDGIHRRHMQSGEEWQTLIDLGLMVTPVGQAKYVTGAVIAALVEVPAAIPLVPVVESTVAVTAQDVADELARRLAG